MSFGKGSDGMAKAIAIATIAPGGTVAVGESALLNVCVTNSSSNFRHTRLAFPQAHVPIW
jgi:hypothetical protein